jgi:hypothetical protein
LIDAMFERADRYDLSEVGRYKMNQRLELDRKKTTKLARCGGSYRYRQRDHQD